MADIKADYADRLWTLSSAIAAFSILQALAFAYYFKETGFGAQVHNARDIVIPITVLATIGYIVAICLIDRAQLSLVADDAAVSKAVILSTWLKVIAVYACGVGVMVLAIIAA